MKFSQTDPLSGREEQGKTILPSSQNKINMYLVSRLQSTRILSRVIVPAAQHDIAGGVGGQDAQGEAGPGPARPDGHPLLHRHRAVFHSRGVCQEGADHTEAGHAGAWVPRYRTPVIITYISDKILSYL